MLLGQLGEGVAGGGAGGLPAGWLVGDNGRGRVEARCSKPGLHYLPAKHLGPGNRCLTPFKYQYH